jgi:hypothetical protein
VEGAGGLALLVAASSDGAMELLEKAADGSTRDELTAHHGRDHRCACRQIRRQVRQGHQQQRWQRGCALHAKGARRDQCPTMHTTAMQNWHEVQLYNKSKGKAIGMYSKPTKNKAKLYLADEFPKVKQPIIAPHRLGWY